MRKKTHKSWKLKTLSPKVETNEKWGFLKDFERFLMTFERFCTEIEHFCALFQVVEKKSSRLSVHKSFIYVVSVERIADSVQKGSEKNVKSGKMY